MAIDIPFKASVDVGDGAKSLRTLKQEFKDAQLELDNVVQGTDEYTDALKRLGDVRAQINDLNEEINAFAGGGGKLKAFQNVTQGIAGGFAAATSAAALFGSEGEDLQKVLLKVQAAMAFQQGIAGLEGLGQSFKAMKAVAIDTFKGIRGAILASGIGALVILLGTIVAYWDDIKGAVNGVSAEQEKLNKATETNLKAEQEKLKTVGDQDNVLKLQGKSEKDILEIKKKQTDEVISATEANIKQQEITSKLQIEAAQRNKDILKGILDFISIPITSLLSTIDAVGSALGKNFELTKTFSSGLDSVAKLVFDPEETREKAENTIQESRKALDKLINDRAGFQLQINKINEDAADKLSKLEYDKLKDISDNYDKQLALKKKFDEDLRKIAEENKKREEEERLNKLKKIEEDTNAEIDRQNRSELAHAERVMLENENNLQAQIDYLEKKKNIELQNTELTEQERLLIIDKYEDEEAELKKKYRQQELDATLDIAQKTNDALIGLSDLYFAVKQANTRKGSAEELRAAKQQFKINKALSIHSTIISGIQGVVNALSAQSVIPDPFGTILKGITATSIGIATAANVAKISATQFNPGSSGGGSSAVASLPSASSGAAPTINAPINSNTKLNPDGSVVQQQPSEPPPVRAVVVETDVTSTQQRVRQIEQQSQIQ